MKIEKICFSLTIFIIYSQILPIVNGTTVIIIIIIINNQLQTANFLKIQIT